jgi:protein involved in polysaccharide export with SLBB domain
MNRLRKLIEGFGVVVFLLLVGLGIGCETTGTPQSNPNMGSRPEDGQVNTTFSPGDKLIIEFDLGLPTPWTQSVREDGMISLPYNKSIMAAGKKKGELEQLIHDVFVPDILRRLTVNIRSEDRTYFVDGEVRTPGQKVHTGLITATKAIAAAGDFTDFANKRNVEVIRSNGQKIKMNALKALQDPSKDVAVFPGDRVHVYRRVF